jgi:histidine kinase
VKDTQPPRTSLITSLILAVGITLLVCIAAWAFFSIRYQKQRMMGEILMQTERLSNTIKLGTHYAMMLNSGEDIDRIIRNISRQKEIEFIRIYNKEGLVRFSNRETEIGRRTTIDSEACRNRRPPNCP